MRGLAQTGVRIGEGIALRWATWRRRRTALAGAIALLAAFGWAAGSEAVPGPPGAIVPSGYAALDPCPSPAPGPPKVTVGWDPASWSQGDLLWRRYVVEPLAGDGLPAGFETGSNLMTLDVPAPADGRLFRFRVFGRESKIQMRTSTSSSHARSSSPTGSGTSPSGRSSPGPSSPGSRCSCR